MNRAKVAFSGVLAIFRGFERKFDSFMAGITFEDMASKTLNVSLPRELSGFIDRKIKSGQYQDAADVVRDALRHLAAAESAAEAEEFEEAFAGGHSRPETEEEVARVERAVKSGRKR